MNMNWILKEARIKDIFLLYLFSFFPKEGKMTKKKLKPICIKFQLQISLKIANVIPDNYTCNYSYIDIPERYLFLHLPT